MSKKHSQKSVHVVPNGDQWRVHNTTSNKPGPKFDTQRDAIDYGKEVAKKERTELVIHRPNGQIRDSISYGNDPNPPKDKK